MEATTATALGDLDTPSEVLSFAREQRATADRAEANVLQAAVVWAYQHPAESLEAAEVFRNRTCLGFGDTAIPLAGPGAPLDRKSVVYGKSVALGGRRI